MPRRRRKHANWPYRFAWLAILLAFLLYVGVQSLVGALTYGNRSYGIDWGLVIVSSFLDATIAAWFVAVGAAIGSFLNVVAFRLPAGRGIGGYSSCPYCCTPIEGSDNVPVLAWIKLRGRCRTCRLPISVQYPLVEGVVALLFLAVYLTEVTTGGGNLPVKLPSSGGATVGIFRLNISVDHIMRVGAYLFALSGLVAAALIAVRRKAVPMALYLWLVLPLLVLALYSPSVLIVPWRDAPPAGPIEARLNVLSTLICGGIAGIALARLLAPVLYPGFDRSLISRDAVTNQARQNLGAFAVIGAIVGWQAVVSVGWSVMLVSILGAILLRRFRNVAELADLTVWSWLGLLVFRGFWSSFDSIPVFPAAFPPVMRYVVGALLLAPLALILRKVALPIKSNVPEIGEDDEDHEDAEDVFAENTSAEGNVSSSTHRED